MCRRGFDGVPPYPAAAVVMGPGGRAVFCETSTYQGSATAAWPLTCDYVWGDPAHAATWAGTWHNNKFHLQAAQDTLVVVAGASVTSGLVVDSLTWTSSARGRCGELVRGRRR